jgi:hypothetical protein
LIEQALFQTVKEVNFTAAWHVPAESQRAERCGAMPNDFVQARARGIADGLLVDQSPKNANSLADLGASPGIAIATY